MVNFDDPNQTEIIEFTLPFSGRLHPNNMWIKLSRILPWDELSEKYTKKMCKDFGRLSIKPRVAIGALIIKHYKNLSDEDTIEEIKENPYLQFFLGYKSFQYVPCFDPSLFVTIRNRIGAWEIARINEIFIQKIREHQASEKEQKKSKKRMAKSKNTDEVDKDPKNHGKMIVDATVAPSNIKYPTDLDLLGKSREISEELIDRLYSTEQFDQKPRTYCRKARKDYLRVVKMKRKRHQDIRWGIKKQLQYLRRNLGTIGGMLSNLKDHPAVLSSKERIQFATISQIFEQQEKMFVEGVHSVENRIVSIDQPYIRPIVRGKQNADVEFGAKASLSVIDGFVYLSHLSWEPFNEGLDLIAQVNRYKLLHGYYPKVVLADKIYGTLANRNYPEDSRLELGERNEIEGKIGTAKTRFGLGKVMTKRQKTSGNYIAMAIFTLNMATALRRLLLSLLENGIKWIKTLFDWDFFISRRPFLLPSYDK